jgi:beta-galactosidase
MVILRAGTQPSNVTLKTTSTKLKTVISKFETK